MNENAAIIQVTSRGHMLDSAVVADRAQADAYKRAVRVWAADRNVWVQVTTQPTSPASGASDEPCFAYAC